MKVSVKVLSIVVSPVLVTSSTVVPVLVINTCVVCVSVAVRVCVSKVYMVSGMVVIVKNGETIVTVLVKVSIVCV